MKENSTRPAWKIEIIPAPASNADEILSGRKQPVPTAELRGKTVILRQPGREIHVSGADLDRMCEALVILQDLKTSGYPDWVNRSEISIGTGRKASLALIAACTTVALRRTLTKWRAEVKRGWGVQGVKKYNKFLQEAVAYLRADPKIRADERPKFESQTCTRSLGD